MGNIRKILQDIKSKRMLQEIELIIDKIPNKEYYKQYLKPSGENYISELFTVACSFSTDISHLEFLVEMGADINHSSSQLVLKPLSFAIHKGNDIAVDFLLKSNCKLMIQRGDESGDIFRKIFNVIPYHEQVHYLNKMFQYRTMNSMEIDRLIQYSNMGFKSAQTILNTYGIGLGTEYV